MNSRMTDIECQFNRSSAGSYDVHAKVQRLMAEQLAKSLIPWKEEGVIEASNILEIGCGTGTLTGILVNEWSKASIIALDIAPGMIKVAEQRVRSGMASHLATNSCQPDRVSFIHADVERWSADAQEASFDLIVSNACFQWLENPKQTIRHLRQMLRPGGLLVFATFGPETFIELHQSFNDVYRASGMDPQRHGLSFQSDTQWKNLLMEAGFSSIQKERSIQKETYSSVRDFLHSVKAMGASTSEAVATPGLSSRRLFANMYKAYEDKFSIKGGIAATYDLLLIQARVSHSYVHR
ncbi:MULTISPECIES: malonyl-ACP O-methyltransferase BioC [unclassified Paenibacillus]|uniref:malonyl-ACP O-methyltransferase BioC n=1 Tax=unclassified Paenibacillus TaxID=185978 RepID=UPI00277FCF6D|nr:MULTISPECIES: malonyl-ACP O-methyltransferase BioC [unclassified Paenibacillus]MDQ0896730.1 malonyl-CoA O-methyltransferase [Paenibacillus sp. V4I7]MDQ0917161.1 malonyl-CoA O-methyltransferase [Paenibacillus sp. V4I5]